MHRIGLLSDTHGFYDNRIADLFGSCHEIWHAGDIGSDSVADRLTEIKPLVAVYGNIDGTSIRSRFPQHQRLIREGVEIWMTHIGGYPGNYSRHVVPGIYRDPPGLFISGHSHILKVMPDKKHSLIHMNPGAAGRIGLHMVRTLIRFEIESGSVQNVDVIELGPRSNH